jgi:hypothetical protein
MTDVVSRTEGDSMSTSLPVAVSRDQNTIMVGRSSRQATRSGWYS